ncbi:MAG: hypothetical protein B9S38_13360 [Verrucomicrobiia bacterium Tous-C4TDCM]|nr:MAG: hypothetical protein B9S38_13360 [Verrucomicrobiae bacterium Tous-C4TDCM]
MAFESAFAQAFLYLAAALVAIVVGKRFGLGAVLGYLIAGALIGPWGLGWIGREGEQVTHFAEFGVVIMLFLVGLELEPSHPRRARRCRPSCRHALPPGRRDLRAANRQAPPRSEDLPQCRP